MLNQTICFYQKLGNWSRHAEITRDAFAVTQDVFLHAGLIGNRHLYEEAVAPPPAG